MKEGEFVIKRSSFTEEDDYKKEVLVTTNNLLTDLLRRVGITAADLKDLSFIHTYKVGKDTDLPYSDLSGDKKLETYHAYGIKILQVEHTTTHVRILIPSKSPEYGKSVGNESDVNFIPSTIAFIKDYQPKSGYTGELGKTGKYKNQNEY